MFQRWNVQMHVDRQEPWEVRVLINVPRIITFTRIFVIAST